MAVKIKPPDPPPSKAYLVSFGDTMTTLLAFFIVMCSLADDQTGANLYQGTGSFVGALSGSGLKIPSDDSTSANAIVREDSSPLYLADAEGEGERSNKAAGPDEESNALRVIDRESDVYKRYLNELERLTQVDKLPELRGEFVIDIFNRFRRRPPYLKSQYKSAFARVAPLLRRESHRVEFIVWAPMPSPTAWQKAAETADQFHKEMLELTGDRAGQSKRLKAVAKTWPFSDVKRPYASIIVQKVAVD